MRPLPTIAVLCALSLGSGGCTVVKPIVGVVAGPAVILGSAGGNWGGCGCDGRALLGILAIAAAVGAGAGLVTGVISDVQYVCGYTNDATRNWWNPFATNTWDG